ncbi:MAG: ABC transporter ATP-binding protein [Anaerovibrio sp.]
MNLIKDLIHILNTRQKFYCVILVLSMVVGGILEALGIGAIMPFISIIEQEDFLYNHVALSHYFSFIGIYDNKSFMIMSAVLLVVLYWCKNLYMVWQIKLQYDFATKNQILLAKAMMKLYLLKPYIYHKRNNSALLLRNISLAGGTVFSSMIIPLFSIVSEIITALMIWVMLCVVDVFTAVMVAFLLGGMVYFILKFFKKTIIAQGEIQSINNVQYTKWIKQSLGAIKEIKVSKEEKFFLEKFYNSYKGFGEASKKYMFINQLPRMIIESLVITAIFSLIIVRLIIGGQVNDIIPLLGFMSLAAFRLMPSANRIVNLYNTIRFQAPFFYDIYDELLVVKKEQWNESSINIEIPIRFDNKIEIDNIWFKYPDSEQYILKKINFCINKGSFVGIVGSSGSGKTTFIDIILGVLKPSSGIVKVDGINIFDKLGEWQKIIGYVPQNIYILDASIRENIAFGISANLIDEDRVKKCLQMAELYDYVNSLPLGTYSIVGEHGASLSGGQKQRIGIARALYKDPSILVLDEATSALDVETESSISRTIQSLKGSITIIAIAHRLSTIAACDYLMNFDELK